MGGALGGGDVMGAGLGGILPSSARCSAVRLTSVGPSGKGAYCSNLLLCRSSAKTCAASCATASPFLNLRRGRSMLSVVLPLPALPP